MAIVSTGTCPSPPSVSNDNCWFLMVMRFDRLYGEAVNEKLCNGRYCGCNLRALYYGATGLKIHQNL
jgi:hypothetical protein